MKMLEVFIFFSLCSWSLTGVFGVEVKSVMEGDSVTLHTETMDLILWRFGPKEMIIARMDRKDSMTTIYNNSADGRFRGRLKLDETGSLIITNTTTTHSGLYKVYSKTEIPLDTFNLTVYAPLPTPNIIRESLAVQKSSSSSGSEPRRAFLCSVVNVSHVTLSWFKGNSVLSSISVSDLSRSVSLRLECLDESYSCVVNNPIRNQTTHLNNTELCQTCSEYCICCCSFTEVVIRWALSGLVGVATVVILVFDITSRRVQQKKREKTSPSNSD